jgi:chemotaxis protein methyltransferase CheR
MNALAEDTRLANGLAPSRTLSPREFKLFQRLIHEEAGIYLSEAKQALLVGRLSRRLRALGLTSFGDYYERVVAGDPEERIRMLDCICTNETHFFREPQQFTYLETTLIPEWRAEGPGRTIRVWSAACSTGEEPYSLAMLLLRHFPPSSGFRIEILASDLSTRALSRAQEGVWPIERKEEIPEAFLKRFMLRGQGRHAGQMKAGDEIRDVVRFARVNLNDDDLGVGGPFDLVFCRNVLIYFDAPSKAAVIRRLLKRMSPKSHLFLGHAESLLGFGEWLRRVGPTVYRPEPGACA